jgi:GDP-4-dehydro-6-deoxy-D-mannose reductase
MKLLITGYSGFVSYHFMDLLNKLEPGSEVLGIDKMPPAFDAGSFPDLSISFKDTDLLNRSMIEETLTSFQPEYILHLASVSSVAQSWETPLDSFVNNTNIFLNLVELIRIRKLPCRLLSIGSSEEFGQVKENELPLTEEHPLKPLSPYAVARVSQEMLSKIYADGYGLDIIMTRSFNHIGPRQKDIFVISSFAKQLVSFLKDKKAVHKIITGDLTIVRDFVDVRDVVKAYYMLMKNGRKGEIYNICSGHGVYLQEIIGEMSAQLGLTIEVEINPALIRPNDNRKIIGSFAKIKNELGWEPSISLATSLADIIGYWKEKKL